MERIYSVPEVADTLQVSVATVRRWIREGKLRCAKVGKAYRIIEPDLKAFIDSRMMDTKKD